jgi:outer membrane protein
MKQHAIFLSILAVFSQPLAAADLLQTYREARSNDAVYASARAALQAGREKLPQGQALLLPSVNATGNTTYNDNQILFRNAAPGPFVRKFNSNAWSVTLSQPLVRMQNWEQYQQAGFQVAQAEASFGQTSQDLIVRVAQAYFDVLASQDSLAFIQAQKTAISEQLAQAKRNFEVGTATITDTHEAQARFDLATSQEIAAQNDLEFKKRVVQQLIGKFPDGFAPLKVSAQLDPPQPHAMEPWVDSAEKQNFTVRIQEAGVEIATREVRRNRAGHLPTLDLIGTYGETGASSNVLNGTGSDTRGATLGLQLSVPLYAGGGTTSRVREAVANLEKSRNDLENARRSAALASRQSYLGVTNGMAQVRALEQALISSQSALDSNKLGYEVGVRINIDVLNAQQQLFSTKRDLSRARYETLLNGLRLKAAAGALAEEDLEAVNRLLGTD